MMNKTYFWRKEGAVYRVYELDGHNVTVVATFDNQRHAQQEVNERMLAAGHEPNFGMERDAGPILAAPKSDVVEASAANPKSSGDTTSEKELRGE